MKFLIIIISIFIFGCATPNFNYKTTVYDVSVPLINTVTVVAVGEKMLAQGIYTKLQVLNVLKKVNASWGITINEGVFPKTGEDANGIYFSPRGSGGDAGSITKNSLMADVEVVMVDKESGNLCVVMVEMGRKFCESNSTTSYELKEKEVLLEDAIQQTLLYNGIVNGVIKISYREFIKNTARPSFTNNVEYDLKISNIFSYKGASIEVIDATNQNIKYKVLKNFNKAKELNIRIKQEEGDEIKKFNKT